MQLANGVRSTMANAATTTLNSGTLKLYTGASPGVNNAATGTLLATLTFGSPAFGSALNGVATANPIASGTAAASGTAGYARLSNSGGNAVADLSVGVGTGEVQLPSLSITSGQLVSCGSGEWDQLAS